MFMIAPFHSHKNNFHKQLPHLKFHSSWYLHYICNQACIFVSNMVSSCQPTFNKDAVAKTPPPWSSSKANLTKPPKAPNCSLLKEPLSCLTSSKSVAMADLMQMPLAVTPTDSSPMEVEATNEMEIVAEQTTEEQTPTILALIAELKHDIATVVTDMQTLFRQQQQPRNPFEGFKLTPMPT